MFNTLKAPTSMTSQGLKILAASLLLILAACSQKTPTVTATKPDQPKAVTPAPRVDDQARAMYQQGLDAMGAKDYASAMRLFNQFAERHPDSAGAQANLALIEFRNDHPQRAQKLITKSLQLNPDAAQAHNLRAQIALDQGEIKLALKHYQRAVELDPQYANAHYNLALLYDIYLRDIELALQHYRQYLAHSTEKDEKTAEWVKHLESMLNNE